MKMDAAPDTLVQAFLDKAEPHEFGNRIYRY